MKLPIHKLIGVLLIAAFLGACSHGRQIGTQTSITKPGNSGEVCIIRKSSMVGAAISYVIAIDHQELFTLGPGEYAVLQVEPGSRLVSAKAPIRALGTRDEVRSIDIHVASGQTVYVSVRPSFPNMDIEQLDEASGMNLMRKSKRVGLRN